MSTYAKVGGEEGRGRRGEGGEGGGGEGGWVRRGQERVGSRIYNRKAKAEIKNFKAIICCIFTVYHSAKNLYPAEFYYFHLTSTEAKRKFYMRKNINLYSASVI